GADDTTYALARLAGRPEIRADEVSALMVSRVDPSTTDAAWSAGVRGRLTVQVGGKIAAREPGPVPLAVEVAALDESGPTGRAAALRVLDAEPSAAADALATARPTGLTVVVTGRRSQWASKRMFARLGLSMTGFDIVTVKMGYLEPDQYEAAADWLLALTPGGVDQDLLRLGHSRIDRPMIPFDAEIPAPTRADVGSRRGPLGPSDCTALEPRDPAGERRGRGLHSGGGRRPGHSPRRRARLRRRCRRLAVGRQDPRGPHRSQGRHRRRLGRGRHRRAGADRRSVAARRPRGPDELRRSQRDRDRGGGRAAPQLEARVRRRQDPVPVRHRLRRRPPGGHDRRRDRPGHRRLTQTLRGTVGDAAPDRIAAPGCIRSARSGRDR